MKIPFKARNLLSESLKLCFGKPFVDG